MSSSKLVQAPDFFLPWMSSFLRCRSIMRSISILRRSSGSTAVTAAVSRAEALTVSSTAAASMDAHGDDGGGCSGLAPEEDVVVDRKLNLK